MATLQHTDELYHILEDEICALKILPGEALSENQLCKRFGVSRTPIRSVLQRLEQNRFVQIIPCKGTIVTAIDTGVVDQLIFQRVAVEGMVFRDFVQSCSPMEILAVEHLYNMLLEAAAGRSDPENFDFNHFLSCDLAMHEYWFHKTSKEYLWEQMTRPQADYSRFIRLDIVGARNVSSVVSEHAEMLRILREKDLDAIEPLMRTHLYGGVSRMGSKIYSDEYRGYFKLPENKKIKKAAAQFPVQRPSSGCASRSRTYDGGVKVPCLTAWRWRTGKNQYSRISFICQAKAFCRVCAKCFATLLPCLYSVLVIMRSACPFSALFSQKVLTPPL